MTRILPSLLIAIATIGQATAGAGDCSAARAAHGDRVFICRMACNDHRTTIRRIGCFGDLVMGMRWLMRQAPLARGQMYMATCWSPRTGNVTMGDYHRMHRPETAATPRAGAGTERRAPRP